jgi:hypothetical protein
MSAIQKARRCILHWSFQAIYLILHYKKKCLLFLAFFFFGESGEKPEKLGCIK